MKGRSRDSKDIIGTGLLALLILVIFTYIISINGSEFLSGILFLLLFAASILLVSGILFLIGYGIIELKEIIVKKRRRNEYEALMRELYEMEEIIIPDVLERDDDDD